MVYGNTERALFITRLALGWLMFYAGLSKIISESWTAAPYLLSAKTLPAFYSFLVAPSVILFVNAVNEWSLLLLGVSLMTGVWIRISAPLGVILMVLYYLPALAFPYAGHGLLIDEHVIYALLLLVYRTQAAPFSINEPLVWLKRLAISLKTRKMASL